MERGEEPRHLREGPKPGESHPLIDYIIARCPGNAEDVLRRCKEVLDALLTQDPEDWPPDEAWPSRLPAWFVAKSAPEMTKDEADRFFETWRSLPNEERMGRLREDDAHGRWSVLGTVHWFRPEERSWWWWDGVAVDKNTVRVTVEVEGSPYASGALCWILRAAGADSAETEI